MALPTGTRIGPYEIGSSLGAGGMGEVYRARDPILGRDVAIKILPESMSGDPDRLMRFEREARLLASLSHPNIAHVYGVETWRSSRALVMELVPGATLAERLAHGPLSLSEALDIARQIAAALSTAHDQGIVHRDLKPANVKAPDGGVVKVLDFGLAKALAPDPAAVSGGSTVTSPALTAQGVILGTAAYMSPEQARGKPVDRRADIWAFGCVLYEMLTGSRPFDGETVQDTAIAVLTLEPDWSKLPAATPAPLRTLLRRCLTRDRSRRLADIHDARLEIDDALSGATTIGPAGPAPAARLRWLPWAIAVLATAALAIGLWSREEPREWRADVVTPPMPDQTMFALSPTGDRLVFAAGVGDEARLWLRDLHGPAAVAAPIAGTEGAIFPFWSPDGDAVGFFSRNKLKKVELGGGAVTELADAPNPQGGTWGRHDGGTVLFAKGMAGGVWRIRSGGDGLTRVTTLEPGQMQHRHPRFLGDGPDFLFVAQKAGGPEGASPGGLYLGSLESGTNVRLAGTVSQGLRLDAQQILYLDEENLVRQVLDRSRRQLSGEPALVAQGVARGILGQGAFSVSSGGVLAYRRSSTVVGRLQWVDRTGSLLSALGAEAERLTTVALSPDDRRAATSLTLDANHDIYVVDTTTGQMRRRTSAPANDSSPIWAPDGRSVFFTRSDGLYRRDAESDAPEMKILDIVSAQPLDVSAGNDTLLFRSSSGETQLDIQQIQIGVPGATPSPLVNSPARESHAQYSPDGQWIAYTSNESGPLDIWVKRLSDRSIPQQVTRGGATMPRWRSDGTELYYLTFDGTMLSLPVSHKDSQLEFGAPEKLFQAPVALWLLPGTGTSFSYAVSSDGRRFLLAVDHSVVAPITLVLNWKRLW